MAVCERARTPKIYHPHEASWWRGLVRWLYYTGLRIETGVLVQWNWIQPDGHAREVGSWLTVPGRFYKGGQPKRFWLSQAALEAAEALRGITGSMIVAGWPHSLGYLLTCRWGLLNLSAIPPQRRFGFHGLRKALGTELWRINPGIAQMVLGHEKDRTTREHYVNPSVVAAALAAVPRL